MEKHHYVYEIVNLVNHMKYIGVRSCTCVPEKDTRYMSSSEYVKAAIKEFGLATFEKKILAVFETRELAVAHEVHLHAILNVDYDDGYYNRAKQKTTGFDTSSLVGEKNWFYGKHHSEATKQKLREKNLGKPSPWKGKSPSQKTRELLRQANLGKRASSTTKKKMQASHMGLFAGKKHPLYGKRHTPETRTKIGDGVRGKLKSDITRARMRAAQKANHPMQGRQHSEESRKKISEGLRRRWQQAPVVYVTPLGVFSATAKAAQENKCSTATIIRRCRSNMPGWSTSAAPRL